MAVVLADKNDLAALRQLTGGIRASPPAGAQLASRTAVYRQMARLMEYT